MGETMTLTWGDKERARARTCKKGVEIPGMYVALACCWSPPPHLPQGFQLCLRCKMGLSLDLELELKLVFVQSTTGKGLALRTAHYILHTIGDEDLKKTQRRPQRRPPNNHGNQNSGSTKVQTSTPLIIKSGDDARQSLLNVVVAPLLPCINASSSHSPATPVPPPSMTWVSEPIIKYWFLPVHKYVRRVGFNLNKNDSPEPEGQMRCDTRY